MSWLSDIFGGGGGDVEFFDPYENQQARGWLYSLLTSHPPEIPARPIAPLGELEQQGQQLLGEYVGGGMPRAYELGMSELEKTLGGGYDPATSLFYKGFRQESEAEEERLANKLGRRSQIAGMFKSTPAIKEEIRERSPFAASRLQTLGQLTEAERSRRFGAIPILAQYGQLAEAEPIKKLAAISQYGPQGYEQSILDAIYQAQMANLMFPYTTQADIASRIMGAPVNAAMTQPEPGMLSQISPLLNNLILASAMGGGGGGGGGLLGLTGYYGDVPYG
jgi:hypothetical protein